MRWWKRMRRQQTHKLHTLQHDKNLEDAEAHVQSIKERSDKVVDYLAPRHRRNHWTEAIQQIARGG